MAYDSVDFELLAMIREHGLKQLLPPISGGDTHPIIGRIILSRAFDIVLRRTKDDE
jgi:hypothetical protein